MRLAMSYILAHLGFPQPIHKVTTGKAAPGTVGPAFDSASLFEQGDYKVSHLISQTWFSYLKMGTLSTWPLGFL